MLKETMTPSGPTWHCCANCDHYQKYHQHEEASGKITSVGWCKQPDQSKLFRNGLMVYEYNACERFECKARGVSFDRDEHSEAIANAAFDQMQQTLSQ